jgi:hypothetical protein
MVNRDRRRAVKATSWAACLFLTLAPPACGEGFKHCGFYLHEGWLYNHPFAVRSWSREDFASMYQLLNRFGFDRVMNWPMFEAIPAPLSDEDAGALREYRRTINDAHAAGLEFWLVQCANLTPRPQISAKPWKERNPYPVWNRVRLDHADEASAYLAHRRAMMEIVNSADAYVTIDGDPGGYPGAKPEDWLSVFQADRAAIDAVGVDPAHQRVIPWIWCGWGTDRIWGDGLAPAVRASLEVFTRRMPEPWALLSGRSHRDGWANGRINVELTAAAGLMPRATILCYEAIEFEPAIPGAVLQFASIRTMLREEAVHAAVAEGVFGNAQQPVMVLPNLYFFARSARDIRYLDTPDDEVLSDLADLLGGPRDVLVPAWRCLALQLSDLPSDLASRLRETSLVGETAAFIPGGPKRYVEILAAQVESRRSFLEAIADRPSSDEDAARRLAAATAALVSWWQMHHYVGDGGRDAGFAWRFVRAEDVAVLKRWIAEHVTDPEQAAIGASQLVAAVVGFDEAEALARIKELL